ncbi:4'-phosphopantetheinyl transferase [Modestobacter italicus]|uniref:4'-phosphopantetheinyl transferase n=1 Tax=Modestobacter italicus (strain DSM 44449 / CECT 9708 / BC 501) TaxID=2732864 RepID=I4ER62_MODI5|nr:4'-phosphopantetheinyl transferase superfamily protein [Modestobacter marinus]CCH85875.1 4'-phosphopantetheinyl transferase [Modestobacter marinus]
MTRLAVEPGRRLGLPAGAAVRLRCLDLAVPAAGVAAARRLLSAAELAHADRGSPSVRDRRVLLRAALRTLAGEVLDLSPSAVPLADPPGRPSVLVAGVDASCSASAGIGVVAVVRGARVGVDVERVGRSTLAEAAEEAWLAPAELAALTALPEADQAEALTRCWTQKEAVLKGLGVGLHRDPRTVLTPVASRGHGSVGDWQLTPVAVPAGWVASRAVRPAAAAPQLLSRGTRYR